MRLKKSFLFLMREVESKILRRWSSSMREEEGDEEEWRREDWEDEKG
jgi:hypothetical protein